mmetsp:Transcript_40765/g.49453  ORF Transcript_40765/g.49453 Transcript_40765/m.49453 type:complete len:222 (-) Transcript_40765:114-779(-)|eukprot:CAMPEP_0197852390 /NCGR_PEP_ID=MMETSP1438-20131217/20478_1 /TAXON_ID=1461541 /ORGANISM="Pterosperma sp., Strain CCMP1384" /LENGTH=221 /DNA_ID=CAMNT_0043466427 /DNA_START=244 /DNA_END=909 /DNA_ORIENTATION=-
MASAIPGALFAPSADRNKGPILEVLKKHLPAKGHVVEIASGTGQHVAHFARSLPSTLTWQPTEYAGHPGPTAPQQQVTTALDSIVAYTKDMENVSSPCELDASAQDWSLPEPPSGGGPLVGVLATNVTHISPYNVTEGLVKGAYKVLAPSGQLLIYGPFKVGGVASPESNVRFDETLKSQNAEWGLRDVEAVQALAKEEGFHVVEVHEMPANNLMLVFKKN